MALSIKTDYGICRNRNNKLYGIVIAVKEKMKKKFSKILRRIRESKKLSQTELAERTGFQPSAISHFETGRRSPSFANLKKLADALSVSIDYLLGRDNTSKSAGPAADQLFRDFEKMSSEDQDTITEFASMLAKKNREKGA
jgi:transcriptional regulator with XRE-family HTH domain